MPDPKPALADPELPASLRRAARALRDSLGGEPAVAAADLFVGFYRVQPPRCSLAGAAERSAAGRALAGLTPGECSKAGRGRLVARLRTPWPALVRIQLGGAAYADRARDTISAGLVELAERLDELDPLLAVEACSPSLGGALARLRRIAASPLSVLVLGETGTGKEVVARAVHRASGRRGRMVAENCAALPENLLEAELFGARKGAFTGSIQTRRGLLLDAQGGTLFLDEIGEMPAPLQVKLLRALQEREVRPVGGSHAVPFDARVLAATNRGGAGSNASGLGLRRDLYYRLATVTVELPPLRRRRRDLPWLAATLLDRAAEEGIGPGRCLAPGALDALAAHAFPGNVRELDNVLRQASSLATGGTITPAVIANALPRPSREPWEAQMIRDALDTCAGVKSAAAKRLGWTRQKLYRRLKALGLQDAAP
jgi:DNA-binding NtrC family response regulator